MYIRYFFIFVVNILENCFKCTKIYIDEFKNNMFFSFKEYLLYNYVYKYVKIGVDIGIECFVTVPNNVDKRWILKLRECLHCK